MLKKKAQVIMLPTKSKSKIGLNPSALANKPHLYYSEDGAVYSEMQHLYIIDDNDSEIKEPCWVLSARENDGHQSILYVENVPKNTKYYDMKGGYALFRHLCRKIIASTDRSLECRFPDGSGFYSMPQPSDSFISKYIESYNNGKPIVNVMVEWEQKGWISEKTGKWQYETADFEFVEKDKFLCNYTPKVDKNNTITITRYKETWSKEEVIALYKANCERLTNTYTSSDIDWIEERL